MNLLSSAKGGFIKEICLPVTRATRYLLAAIFLAFLVLASTSMADATVSDSGHLSTAGVAAGEKLYAVNSALSNVSVIDASSGHVIKGIEIWSAKKLLGIALVPVRSSAYVTDQRGNMVYVIDTSTGDVAGSIKVGQGPEKIKVAPGGRDVFVINRGYLTVNGSISVIDTGTNLVAATIDLNGAHPYNMALSPDGTRAYVASEDDIIYVIDTGTGAIIETISGPWDVFGVSPDGSRLYVAAWAGKIGENNLVTIDLRTKAKLASLPIGSYMASVISPDGSKIYLTGDPTEFDNRVKVIDTSRNTMTAVIQFRDSPARYAKSDRFSIAISPDGNRVYVGNSVEDHIRVIDATTNTELAKIPAKPGYVGIAVS